MNLKQIAMLLIPLLIIPITLYGVSWFGNDAGNAIIGLAFFTGFIKFADMKERKLMLSLAIFAMVFEAANVALGAYKYTNSFLIPFWIPIGWGLVGLYIIKNKSAFERVGKTATLILIALLYLAVLGISGFSTNAIIASVMAAAGTYAISLSSKLPPATFLFTGFLGILIEFAGTGMGTWSYLDSAGLPISAPFAVLGMSYAAVFAFGTWVSRIDEA